MIHPSLQALIDEKISRGSPCLDELHNFFSEVSHLLEEFFGREEKIADELEKARLITEHSTDMLMIFALDGRCVYISPACREILGYSQEELLQQSPYEFVHPDDRRKIRREQVRLIHSREPKIILARAQRKSGEFIWLETITKMVLGENKKLKNVLAVSRDVTKRISTEENLQRTNRELLQTKARLELQTIQLEKQNNQLKQSREEAEAADLAKSAFLSSISHELRTPLNAILGFAQILQKDTSLPDKQRDYVDIMYRSGNHLLEMINDILDISKIESGKMEIFTGNVNLREMLYDLAGMFEMRVKEKNLEFELRLPHGMPEFIIADGKRLRQILINLLGNSVKFTKRGKISLLVCYTADSWNKQSDIVNFDFKIIDTGIGIAPEELEVIFEPFRQSRKNYSEGTGLGLAISRRIARLMGGDITVESRPDEGSVFTLHVQLRVPGGTASMQEESDNIIGIRGNWKPKILVADDTMSNRVVANALLDPVGFICLEAENGKQAIEKAINEAPDLILMDLRMPIMGGLEALQQIRANEKTKEIPIVALTASGFSLTREDLIKQGFDDFVMKPFAIEELFETIGTLLAIEYVRESQGETCGDPPGQSASEKKDTQNIVSMLRTLNGDQFVKLRDAVEIQDFDTVKKIISELAQKIPEEAVGLSSLYNAAANADYKFFSDLSSQLNSA